MLPTGRRRSRSAQPPSVGSPRPLRSLRPGFDPDLRHRNNTQPTQAGGGQERFSRKRGTSPLLRKAVLNHRSRPLTVAYSYMAGPVYAPLRPTTGETRFYLGNAPTPGLHDVCYRTPLPLTSGPVGCPHPPRLTRVAVSPGVDLEVPQLPPLRFVGVVLSGVSPVPSHAPCSTNRTRGSGTSRHGCDQGRRRSRSRRCPTGHGLGSCRGGTAPHAVRAGHAG